MDRRIVREQPSSIRISRTSQSDAGAEPAIRPAAAEFRFGMGDRKFRFGMGDQPFRFGMGDRPFRFGMGNRPFSADDRQPG